MPNDDRKISELGTLAAIDAGDLIAVVPDAGGNTRQINITDLFKNIPVPVGIGRDAVYDLDIAGMQRITFGAVDQVAYDFETTPTRQVEPIRIRLEVEGNMPLGGALPQGGTVTGNVNIIDVEAGVGAGGLVAGAKFSGMSIVIDGHADDDPTAIIFGIELTSDNIASPATKKALRISNDWHTGIVFASGTYTTGIDLDDGTFSTDIRFSDGSRLVSSPAASVDYNLAAGKSLRVLIDTNDQGFVLQNSGGVVLSEILRQNADAATFRLYDGGALKIFFNSDLNANSYFNSGGNLAVGHNNPITRLDILGAFTFHELSADPINPVEGAAALWMSDGVDSGDDGDILMIITAGGVTKTTILVDFSAI